MVASASPLSQPANSRLTRAAIFLVVTINAAPASERAVRELCGDLSSLVRGVGFRNLDGQLSCVMGFGAHAWDRLFGQPRPRDLHPFREINGIHRAVSTPGDVLFHIRAASMDLCFELATHIMTRLSGAVSVADEVHGFKFFDDRDLLGFVDGTENPVDRAAAEATLIGDEDPDFAGGSYVIVQKYLHDLTRWNQVPVEEQENIIGRHKLSDIEQIDAQKKPYAHNVLTSIEENGEQLQIVRDNMPFGEVGKGEFGTYFIGYARSPHRIERMLENMFIGNPPGTYDRLLDFSRAVTGALFFAPTATFLDDVQPDPPPSGMREAGASPSSDAVAVPAPPKERKDASLGIGSLKNEAGQ
ncbi:hypothetical protein GCM10019059_41490 [Camelimonas fluminis]|uniref:Dyp-type peroxidase n=1 Tax=Camelimonas fluminis TaxID=1576911 RepID=A0ABV7UGZ3_9HYPH|nr:Dyp-type peroxidase [Camelimonas fluminis]GHE78393.1 hypothetical protein GCM10019059_41490 [Camelimonas fluminis]